MPSGDQAGASDFSPRNGRGCPPRRGMSIFASVRGETDDGCCARASVGLNQISAASPEKPKERRKVLGESSGGLSWVRFVGFQVPSGLTQRSNWPSRSARNATNLPSDE